MGKIKNGTKGKSALSDMTIREVAVELRVPEITVRRWVASGRLSATRVDRTLRVARAEVERLAPYAARRSSTNGEPPPPGSVAALLEASERCSRIVRPGDVEELERIIAEGCERPGEVGDT